MTPKYQILIHWSNDDNAYIAEVPELPGCMADGKTIAEVAANVEIIIEEWLESAALDGEPIPVPNEKLMYA
ncbi:MAG: type II toxin-antitoxin system HicB family antitoxin [Defluviitaleaceae bacterium]|nr:type II toxin-antitoxin system HicB family antitoxin [Defluviitaleaceae bacterium]